MTRMRKLWSAAGSVILTLLFLSLSSASAKNLPIAWDPNGEPDLAGYNVYYAEEGQQPLRVTVAEAQAVLRDLVPGRTYAIYVTAFNNLGIESAPSETIFYTVPTDSLELSSIQKLLNGTISISGIGLPERSYKIEAAGDLRVPVWEHVGISTADANGRVEVIDDWSAPARFYRIVEITSADGVSGK